MAIKLGNKTKLTSEVEKRFIEAGGGDPKKVFTKEELSEALTQAISVLAENKSPYLLKLYKQMEKEGKVPLLESPVE